MKKSRYKWVRIASFPNAAGARVACLQLEAAEIPNYVDNEHSAETLWYIQPAVGGVRVCVPEEYVEEAQEILEQHGGGEEDEEDLEEEMPREYSPRLEYASLTRCPKCQSEDTAAVSWMRRLAQTLIVLLLGASLLGHPWGAIALFAFALYFLLTKPDLYCLRCRHRWHARAQDA